MANVELVGILNLTPDSFSGDGIIETQQALKAAGEMFANGASYLDVGAESTRPGAEPLAIEEEWSRLRPILNDLVFAYPGHISIDSYHPEIVARTARQIGSFIVNDVTGFNNPDMIELAQRLQLPCIVSHLPQSKGQDIQSAHQASDKIDSLDQVRDELMLRREQLIAAGVRPEAIILDPGIGFGKTRAVNHELLAFAAEVPGLPVMIGYAKKAFLGEERYTVKRNLEAGRIAVEAGARYLRLHADLLPSHKAAFRP